MLFSSQFLPFHQDEMQLQLPMVVGKKGTKEEEKKEVKTVKLRLDQILYRCISHLSRNISEK